MTWQVGRQDPTRHATDNIFPLTTYFNYISCPFGRIRLIRPLDNSQICPIRHPVPEQRTVLALVGQSRSRASRDNSPVLPLYFPLPATRPVRLLTKLPIERSIYSFVAIFVCRPSPFVGNRLRHFWTTWSPCRVGHASPRFSSS